MPTPQRQGKQKETKFLDPSEIEKRAASARVEQAKRERASGLQLAASSQSHAQAQKDQGLERSKVELKTATDARTAGFHRETVAQSHVKNQNDIKAGDSSKQQSYRDKQSDTNRRALAEGQKHLGGNSGYPKPGDITRTAGQ